jgi:hypothetical protein
MNKKNTEVLLEANRNVGLEVNTEKTKELHGYVSPQKFRIKS